LLEKSPEIPIPESELQWSFVRSGGPGGQNVNKIASKAVLRWNPAASPSLPLEIKTRFLVQQQKRITVSGDLVITSQRFRDQERNRQDCLKKLAQLIRQAALLPKRRKPTRPTRGSKEGRLQIKRHRSRRKSLRQRPNED
jgi:ribosome-associated protein